MLSARALQGLKIVALIASPHTGQAVSSKQLSLQLGLSVSYIENLLKTLKQNDLVVANRGPGGGYLLHKPVDKLSVWDVVRCFDTEEETCRERPTPEFASCLEMGHALERLKHDFLHNYPIAEIVKKTPPIAHKTVARQLSSHFKPLAIQPLPKAPNSVFDLPNFMRLMAA